MLLKMSPQSLSLEFPEDEVRFSGETPKLSGPEPLAVPPIGSLDVDGSFSRSGWHQTS